MTWLERVYVYIVAKGRAPLFKAIYPIVESEPEQMITPSARDMESTLILLYI